MSNFSFQSENEQFRTTIPIFRLFNYDKLNNKTYTINILESIKDSTINHEDEYSLPIGNYFSSNDYWNKQ